MSRELKLIDENRKALAMYIFSKNFCMSLDLQLLILDFTFLKQTNEFECKTCEHNDKDEKIPNTEKWTLRIGIVLSEDAILPKKYLSLNYKRIFYEIKAWNEKETCILSSFHSDNYQLAMEAYNAFFENMPNTMDPVNDHSLVYASDLGRRMFRYVYSPNENCTYRVASLRFPFSECLQVEEIPTGPLKIAVGELRLSLAQSEDIIIAYKQQPTAVGFIAHVCEVIHQRDTDNILTRLRKIWKELKI